MSGSGATAAYLHAASTWRARCNLGEPRQVLRALMEVVHERFDYAVLCDVELKDAAHLVDAIRARSNTHGTRFLLTEADRVTQVVVQALDALTEAEHEVLCARC